MTRASWLNDNSYWFALILKERFPESNVVYLLDSDHFLVEQDGRYYDWIGERQIAEDVFSLDEIREGDPNWYSELMDKYFY